MQTDGAAVGRCPWWRQCPCCLVVFDSNALGLLTVVLDGIKKMIFVLKYIFNCCVTKNMVGLCSYFLKDNIYTLGISQLVGVSVIHGGP